MSEESLSCSHFVVDSKTKQSLARISHHASKVQGRCTVCRTPRSVWVCLECFHIGCGRYEKKHAFQHAQETNHYICVNMESPTHLWCYKCDEGIVYFADSNQASDNEMHSASNSSLSSSPSNSQRNGSSKTNNSSIRSQIMMPPDKWKNAQSILKSTPIWHESMNGGMCGMQNLGNTCFMNASLQALLHCPAMIYLFSLPETLYVKKYNRLRLVEEFVKLTCQIWEGKHRSVIPKDMLRCIMYKFPQFRGYGQQDAHEFITCLLAFLHDSFSYDIVQNEKEKETDKKEENEEKEKEKETKKGKKSKKIKRYLETSIISDLFRGQIISQVECSKCGTKSNKSENINDIQVEIPKQEQMDRAVKERNAKPLPAKGWMQSVFTFVGLQSQSIPLSLCLHSYCTSEDLLNTEMYHCDECKSKQEAKKTLLMSRLPEILMIQIKRFSHDSMWRGSSKVSTHVSFPIDALDLRQYIHPKHVNDAINRDTKYDLYSIVKHMGSTGGGHYISFCRHAATAKWYKFDDSRVEEVSPEKVSEQQAYILFYCRRKTDRSHIASISNTLSVSQQLQKKDKNQNNVLLSRYWLHRVHALSRPGPIDNLWLSCYHGMPLKANHERIKYCAIKIPYNTWLELTKKYGLQYNTKMIACKDNETKTETEDVVMKDKSSGKSEDEQFMKKAITEDPHYCPPWELTEKSEECEDCASEQLIRRREYEKAEIRRLEDDGAPQDCALNMKWANMWRNFVHNKTDSIPPRIDNRHIHAGNHMLKDELIKDTDYLMIPSNIWTYLIELYGGGPKIVPTQKPNDTSQKKMKQAPKVKTPKRNKAKSPGSQTLPHRNGNVSH